MAYNFDAERNSMVDRQLMTRDIKSSAVIEAMRSVPRHLFIPENLQNYAYEDSPLPIGLGQTISQPYIVAYMTELLEPLPGMKVLEIGTGSGYQAAVLASLGCEVYTLEVIKEHADRASRALAACGYDNVTVKNGNGYKGWQEEAPFHAIIVTAAPDHIPGELIMQLKDGGRMILPVGAVYEVQFLKLITKDGEKYSIEGLLPVRFVPMVDNT